MTNGNEQRTAAATTANDQASTPAATTTTSSTVPLEKLISTNRLPTSIVGQLLLLAYLPFGIIIFILRVAIGFHAFVISCLLRKASTVRRYVLRFMCSILGLIIRESGTRDDHANVIVTNHISVLDHTAIELIRPCVLPSVWDLPPLLMWVFGYADLGALRGRDILIENAKKLVRESDLPLLAQPEGALTNGQHGLLKFSSWPFSLGSATVVQPALITAARPCLLNVSVSRMASRWWSDICWFLFVPYTVFTIRWLPSVTIADSESPEEFASRTQRCVADAGHVTATSHTSRDVVDYAKRVLIERQQQRVQQQRQQQRRAQLNAHNNSVQMKTVHSTVQLDRMTLKVKEMFPEVPLMAIRHDIEASHSAEETISNITDGRIDLSVTTPPLHKISGTDTSQWSNLFETRKWAIIDENRRKYMSRTGVKL